MVKVSGIHESKRNKVSLNWSGTKFLSDLIISYEADGNEGKNDKGQQFE